MSEIEVKHLTKTFEQKGLHVEALKDINLTKKYTGTMPELSGETNRRSGIDRRKRSWKSE